MCECRLASVERVLGVASVEPWILGLELLRGVSRVSYLELLRGRVSGLLLGAGATQNPRVLVTGRGCGSCMTCFSSSSSSAAVA